MLVPSYNGYGVPGTVAPGTCLRWLGASLPGTSRPRFPRTAVFFLHALFLHAHARSWCVRMRFLVEEGGRGRFGLFAFFYGGSHPGPHRLLSRLGAAGIGCTNLATHARWQTVALNTCSCDDSLSHAQARSHPTTHPTIRPIFLAQRYERVGLFGPLLASGLTFGEKTYITCSCLARVVHRTCLLYTSPSPRDGLLSRMPSSA